MKQASLSLAANFVVLASTLKIEVICSFETSVGFHQTTRSHIRDAGTIYNDRCKNRHHIPLKYVLILLAHLRLGFHAVVFRSVIVRRKAPPLKIAQQVSLSAGTPKLIRSSRHVATLRA
jgi:hypothetical protein